MEKERRRRGTTAIYRGRVVTTWSQRAKRRHLEIQAEPLSLWRPRKHLAQLRKEAWAVAAHLGLEEAKVSVAE